MILPQVSGKVVETGDIQKWLVGCFDAAPEDLGEDTKVFEVGKGMFYPNPNGRERPTGCPLPFGVFFPVWFLGWRDESGPWSNAPCPLVAGISQDGCVGRHPGEDGVIGEKFLVMAFAFYGFGDGKDATAVGAHHHLVFNGVPLLLAGVEGGLILGVFGSTDRPLGGIHDAGGESRTHLQESMQGVDSALGQGQLPSQGSNQDALQELLPGEDVPLV